MENNVLRNPKNLHVTEIKLGKFYVYDIGFWGVGAWLGWEAPEWFGWGLTGQIMFGIMGFAIGVYLSLKPKKYGRVRNFTVIYRMLTNDRKIYVSERLENSIGRVEHMKYLKPTKEEMKVLEETVAESEEME